MKELYAALAKAQGEFPSIPKTKEVVKQGKTLAGKPFSYSYWYADLDSTITAVKPILSKHGLSFGQSIERSSKPDTCVTKIRHSSGEFECSECPIIIPEGDMQKLGAAITYAKRYGLSLALGISTDDDLDANELDGSQFEVKNKTEPTKVSSTPMFPSLTAYAPDPHPMPPAKYTPTAKPLSDAQLKRMYAIARDNKWSPQMVNAWVKNHFNRDSRELKYKEYEEACGFFKEITFTEDLEKQLKTTAGESVMDKVNKARKENTYVDHTAPNSSFDPNDNIPF
jgi:hypothetical protein